MILIRENNSLNDVYYEVETIINDEIIESHILRVKSVTVNKNDKMYYLLFDKDYKLIKSVYNYINIYQRNLFKSEKTMTMTLTSLKFLYSFLELFNLKIETMTYDDCSKLVYFLSGLSTKGEDVTTEFNSVKSHSTVNNYLSSMRTYIKYLKLENHPLLDEVNIKSNRLAIDETNYVASTKYKMKLKQKPRRLVPKYISLDEYKRMLSYVIKTGDKCTECIIRLMYESGMRTGEVLSLTYEDIKCITKETGEVIFKIITRNRVKNKDWQSPKFLMKVTDPNQYKSKDYNQKGYGYQETYISEHLYNCLLDYIDEAHSLQQEKHLDNWIKYTTTDIVSNDFEDNQNFYVFINSLGKPLSERSLFLNIRELFKKCDISSNEDGGKYDGLCHRFRHGFAMFQVQYNNTPLLVLKELMHHTSLSSTLIYYNPDDSDIIKVKDNLSANLYDYIKDFEV